MPQEFPTVFVSSTSKDLTDYREAVRQAIQRLNLHPIIMEDFNPDQRDAVQRCYDEVQRADIFVGIYAHRYGYCPDTDTTYIDTDDETRTCSGSQSITHLEYDWAMEMGIPVCLFVLAEKDADGRPLAWPLDYVDADRQPMQDFKDAIMSQHVVGFFHSPDDLAARVATALPAALNLPPPPTRIRPFQAPRMPDHFVQRPREFNAIRNLLLDKSRENPVAITTMLQGGGGFGKTALAIALCHDEDIRAAFDDGVLWLQFSEHAGLTDVLRLLNDSLKALGQPGSHTELVHASSALRGLLKERDTLLVLDDVWDAGLLRHVVFAPEDGQKGHSAYLITTRQQTIAARFEAAPVTVNEMQTGEAAEMLVKWLAAPPDNLPTLHELAQRLGEWPLLLQMVGGELRVLMDTGRSLDQALEHVSRRLDKRGFTYLDRTNEDDRNHAVSINLDASLEHLPEEWRARFIELAIYREDTNIPFSSVEPLWASTGGLDELDTEDALEAMARLSLFTRYDGGVRVWRLHDVVRAVMHSRLNDPAALHRELVAGWGDLRALPDDYAWRHLAYHLHEGGQVETLRALLVDFEWLYAKLRHTDPNALLGDFEGLLEDDALRLVESTVSMAAHVLDDAAQLPAQLVGRLGLHTENHPKLTPLLEAARAFDAAPALVSHLPTLDAAGGALIRTIPLGYSGDALALTEDGEYLVMAADEIEETTVKVIAWRTGEVLTDFRQHAEEVNAVTVTGDLAISVSYDHTVKVWHWKTGELLTDFKQHSDTVRAVAVAGELAFSASDDRTVKVWHWKTGELLTDFKQHSDWVLDVAVQGELAFSASCDRTVKVWHWKTGELLTDFKQHSDWVLDVAVQGELVFSGSQDSTVKVWRWKTGELLTDFKQRADAVNVVAGDVIFSTSHDNTVKVWRWKTGELLTDFKQHSARISAMAVAGELAFSASYDRTVKVWRWRTGKLLTDFKQHSLTVRAVAVAGELAFSASDDRTVKVWRWKTGKVLTDFKQHSLTVRAVAVAGELAFSASDDRTVKVWRWKTGKLLTDFTEHSLTVRAVAVAGELAFSASQDSTVKVWRWKTGKVLTDFKQHSLTVRAVAVAGELAFSASDDRTVKVWRWRTGKLLTNFYEVGLSPVTAVAIADELTFSASYGTIRVWRWATGKVMAEFKQYSDSHMVRAVAVAGELAFLAFGRAVLVWRWATGEVVATFSADSAVTSLAYEPTHRILLAGTSRGRVHVLRVVRLDHLLDAGGGELGSAI